MPTYPRYTSFGPLELETRLRDLDKTGHFEVSKLPGGSGGRSGRGRLIKSHSCPVSFSDGATGTCSYTRGGPAWHIFRFTHGCGEGSTLLPTRYLTERIGNDGASIEACANRLAALAFAEAIQRERKEYFQRATEGCGRRRHPERSQMKARRAKALSGRYAVCRRVGEHLLPAGKTHERLEDANAEWRILGDRSLVVACCNRLDRCWEIPRFNPLYAECDPRKAPDFDPLSSPLDDLTDPFLEEDEEEDRP